MSRVKRLARTNVEDLSLSAKFLIFSVTILALFGFMDLNGWLNQGVWYRMTPVGIMVLCLIGTYLVLRRCKDRGIRYLDLGLLILIAIAFGLSLSAGVR